MDGCVCWKSYIYWLEILYEIHRLETLYMGSKNLETLYENNPIIPCLEHLLGDETELHIQANDLYKQIKSFIEIEGFNIKRIPHGANGLSNWFTRSKTLLDENNIKVTKSSNTRSKKVTGFSPGATIYCIIRIVSKQTKLKDCDN